jgi:hypothetical protein
MKPQHVTESCGGLGPRRSGNVVAGCKILGLESKKGRRYRREAVAAAVSLYEGVPVYIDHPTPAEAGNPRPFMSKFGVFRNVELRPDGCLYGDLHYNPNHPAARVFEGWVDHDPTQVGFSQNAWCRFAESTGDGQEVIEISRVDSIDLVANPATTNGLFESADSVDSFLPEVAPEASPAEAAPAGLDAALSALISAIVADTTLPLAAKRKKVLVALKLMDDGAEPAEGDEVPVEEDAEEGDDAPPADDDEEKKAEEAAPAWLARVEALEAGLLSVQESVGVKAPLKSPKSAPPKRVEDKPLTADDLVSLLNGAR